MGNGFLSLLFCTLLGINFTVNADESVLKRHQDQGLTFVMIKDVPDQAIGAQMVKEIYGQLNIPVTFKPLPGKRALKLAKQGKVDGEAMRIMKVQEVAPTLIRLSPHINFVEGSVFTKEKTLDIKDWTSLKPHRVGIVRGAQYLQDGTRGFPSLHIAESGDALIDMLNRGRIDLIVTAKYNGMVLLRKRNLHQLIKPLSPPLTTLRLYNYLHVKHRKLAPIIEDHLRELYTSGELQKLREDLIRESLSLATDAAFNQ